MKKYIGALFLFWAGALFVLYYVVQKPGLLNIFAGLLDTFWTIFVAGLLIFNAYGLGSRVLHFTKVRVLDPIDTFLLSIGIGLGILGLLGLFFSVVQLSNEIVLAFVQIILAVFFLLRYDLQKILKDLNSLRSTLILSLSQYSYFTRLVIGLVLLISFLLTLAPPFEAFDVLINHLTLPATLLKEGGLRVVNILPFWYPTLAENVYLWALAFGAERAAQIIHFMWGILTVLLLWHWSTKIWGYEIGRKTLLLVASIPSLPILASWAYADMALCFYAVAAIYTVASYRLLKEPSLLYVAAILSGLAMGVKYQSFVIPLTCGLILLFQRPASRAFGSALRFSLVTLLVALPWYLRNTFYMDNPFYPFIFGGRYWDDFLAAWWTDPGTGIGWNALQIFMLPLNLVLGHRDATFFDGRFGPLFLLLLPITLWVLFTARNKEQDKKYALLSIGCFVVLNFAAWTLGVINTSALWQARYLFPAVMIFTIPTALAWGSLKQLDTSRLRVSFLFDALITLSILLTVADNAIFVIQRNPLAVAVGAQSPERYIERVNPSYSALIAVMDGLPADAHIYSLFEPRTYGLPRSTQPDVILSNFAHDAYLYKTPAAIIGHWRSEQYTYILVYERGREFLSDSASYKFTPATLQLLQETLGKLTLVTQTPDKVYSIYKIP